MSIITISPSGQNITVNNSGLDGSIIVTQSGSPVSTVTINQGQQGPPGASIQYVQNSGNNRVLTSDGSLTGIYAESNLLFDGSKLTVNSIEVSLSGHSHNVSEISGISGYVNSGINNYLNSLSNIGNSCDIEYIVVQDISNNTKLVNISGIAQAISVIDGGGVLYSGC